MPSANELYNEAEQLKDKGRYEEAIAKLKETLEVDQAHVLSHLALAVLYGKVGNHQAAIEHGRRACDLDPNDAFNFTAMSVTYQRAFAVTQNPQFIQLAEEAMAQAHRQQGN